MQNGKAENGLSQIRALGFGCYARFSLARINDTRVTTYINVQSQAA